MKSANLIVSFPPSLYSRFGCLKSFPINNAGRNPNPKKWGNNIKQYIKEKQLPYLTAYAVTKVLINPRMAFNEQTFLCLQNGLLMFCSSFSRLRFSEESSLRRDWKLFHDDMTFSIKKQTFIIYIDASTRFRVCQPF